MSQEQSIALQGAQLRGVPPHSGPGCRGGMPGWSRRRGRSAEQGCSSERGPRRGLGRARGHARRRGRPELTCAGIAPAPLRYPRSAPLRSSPPSGGWARPGG